jgi:hypothetical protein
VDPSWRRERRGEEARAVKRLTGGRRCQGPKFSEMDFHTGNRVGTSRQKGTEAVSSLGEEISFLLSRWNGLQMAVQNQWGGHDSLQKSHQLATDIFSWFSQSNGLYIYIFLGSCIYIYIFIHVN